MKILRSSRKGGAALAAVLIMIILLAAGTAIMIVTGRGQIKEAADVPSVHQDESSSQPDESSSLPDDTGSQPDESSEPEKPVMAAPTIAADYKDIDFIEDKLSSKYAVLMDVDKNEIIAGTNIDKKIYPASLTKILSLIVAVENVEDTTVEFKFTADLLNPLVEERASVAGFLVDESVPFKDLLYGAILVSGADATSALAKIVAGSEKKFADMLNKKAEELGLTGTHFVNASGLHDDDHYSTCKDMAIALAYALKNDTCRKVLTADKYTTAKTEAHPDGILLYSIVQSRFLGYYIDCDGDGAADPNTKIEGGKTGFTDEAGYALATVLTRNNKTYICVNAHSTSDLSCTLDNIAIYEKYLK